MEILYTLLNSYFPIEIKKINVKNRDKNVHGVYVKGGNPRNACRIEDIEVTVML